MIQPITKNNISFKNNASDKAFAKFTKNTTNNIAQETKDEVQISQENTQQATEKSTLSEVIKLRNGAYDDMSSDEKIKANQQLSKGITKIMALAEQYPDLKANENFKDLSAQLTQIEDEIANSRKYYNGTVREFNDKVQMFPSNVVAMIFGYKAKEMFEANEEERKNVKVSF